MVLGWIRRKDKVTPVKKLRIEIQISLCSTLDVFCSDNSMNFMFRMFRKERDLTTFKDLEANSDQSNLNY